MDDDETRVTPLAFTVRWDRIDAQLLDLAHARQHLGTLEEAEAREGFDSFLLRDIAGAHTDDAPEHFGAITRLFWSFVYTLFTGGDAFVAHPAGYAASSGRRRIREASRRIFDRIHWRLGDAERER